MVAIVEFANRAQVHQISPAAQEELGYKALPELEESH